jgi:hypothetical protein
MESLLAGQYVPLLLDPLLGDYARSPPDAREAEVLGCFAAIVNKLKGKMEQHVSRARAAGPRGRARPPPPPPPALVRPAAPAARRRPPPARHPPRNPHLPAPPPAPHPIASPPAGRPRV